ncbi:MAG TPA: LamG domain-containing protein [Ignavibacteria bacterium]
MKNIYAILLLIPLFGISFISCSGSKVENPANFIAYYPFDENLMDMSGHYNHANKFGNTIKYDTGYKNSCIRFFNKNNKDYGDVNDYLQLPNINVIDFSIAFWVKFDKNKHEYQSAVYSFGDDKIGDGPRDFFCAWVSPIGMLWVSMQSGLNSISTPQIDISKGEWVHIAVTIGNGKICLYQNSELYFTKIIDFSHDFYNLPQYVAFHQWNNGKYKSSRFSGMVDELYIFNRVLNKNEIKNIFNGNL